jgi:hypothetical protein
MTDQIIILNVEDTDTETIGEIHITGNNGGISFDFVSNGEVQKSMWMTIDEVLDMMH